MKRLIVVGGIVAVALAAVLALRARAQDQEPRKAEPPRVEYGILYESVAGDTCECWQTADGVVCATDLDSLNKQLGGPKIPGAPLAAVFNAVAVKGWQLVVVYRPNVSDTEWVFSRTRSDSR